MTSAAHLIGKTIIPTFPKPETDDFSAELEPRGATVAWMPMIEVKSVPFDLSLKPDDYQWLVFTSKNGVKFFFSAKPVSTTAKIAALGSATADELKKHGSTATFTGSGATGSAFANELLSVIQPNEKVLMVLGSLAPDMIADRLRTIAHVDRIDVYATTMPDLIDSQTLAKVKAGQYDALAVSSPSAIKNLATALGNNASPIKAICIGETTSAAMRELGIEPLATATEQSYKGLAEAVINYFEQKNKQ